MGVIRKKTAQRGGEGGVKYVCDVCSADITSTVSECAPTSHLRHRVGLVGPSAFGMLCQPRLAGVKLPTPPADHHLRPRLTTTKAELCLGYLVTVTFANFTSR
jgi:hypothetical protein